MARVTRVTPVLALAFLALAVPLGWFMLRSYEGLSREEEAAARFLGVALFEAMERELADLTRREEARPLEAWQEAATGTAPLLQPDLFPDAPWILGYLQSNPDGSLSLPGGASPPTPARRQTLQAANAEIARRATRGDAPAPPRPAASATAASPASAPETMGQDAEQTLPGEADKPLPPVAFKDPPSSKKEAKALAKKDAPAAAPPPPPPPAQGLLDQASGLLARGQSQEGRQSLGQEEKRLEIVTGEQARNFVPPAKGQEPATGAASAPKKSAPQQYEPQQNEPQQHELQAAAPSVPAASPVGAGKSPPPATISPQVDALLEAPPRASVTVEVAPLQSLVLAEGRIFLYRRVVVDGRILRQGLLLDGDAFLRHQLADLFLGRNLANTARCELAILDQDAEAASQAGGLSATASPALRLTRTFPRPFQFLEARFLCPRIPASEARSTLDALSLALGLALVGGFAAVHRAALVQHEHAQRRAGFVSSVTHELKTPLTSIRMYAEMLEQGMAATREREEECLRVIITESERLSRLIGNVLEFSRLEKRARRFDLQDAPLTPAIEEAVRVLRPALRAQDFRLELDLRLTRPVRHDREALVQICLNLLENSLKFAAASPNRRLEVTTTEAEGRARLCVRDHGPGAPPRLLGRIFEDFYRVDDSLTRRTSGAGLGLALVKRLASGMGARVWAENAPEGGLRVWVEWG